ncbi:hypothetical protein CX658_19355 [Pseudomonas amygdali pv. lachrymans]|nr:hypothetical protein CX658_19355 [Pseudomonas amygdali pv. lachrymans]
MTNRPATLKFSQAPEIFPAGLPLEPWEVISDSNHSYEVDASGRLIRKDKSTGARWVSPEFTGNFSITIVPRHSQSEQTYMLYAVCGVVKHMQLVERKTPTPLQALTWPWVLEALVVNARAVDASQTYRGCLHILQQAEADLGFKTGDEKIDAMIGMALCRPALLRGKTARNALECLEDYQLRAATSWHRAHLSD